MRKPDQITVDRALLLYLLHLAESHGLMTDVKLQQLAFLCELQMFDKRVKGFHFEFFRFAYGAFSKDLDNDLLSLRRKGCLENFDPSENAGGALTIFQEGVQKANTDVNSQVMEILQAVTSTYGPQDTGGLSKAVEAVEVSTPEQPEFKLAIRDISFHTILLVPHRIEVDGEFTLPRHVLAKINAALGY
ncbi:MAG TPA: hypothetical protein VJ692_14510 [Nitrospiraceae bacterium]|nr:hypothetical protein [Nitrospiraceae bacterium]